MQRSALLAHHIPVNKPVVSRFFHIERLAGTDNHDLAALRFEGLEARRGQIPDFDAPFPFRPVAGKGIVHGLQPLKLLRADVGHGRCQQINVAGVRIEVARNERSVQIRRNKVFSQSGADCAQQIFKPVNGFVRFVLAAWFHTNREG